MAKITDTDVYLIHKEEKLTAKDVEEEINKMSDEDKTDFLL
jgi:hypothetical protein